MKLLAKVLEITFANLVAKIVHSDQSGFIPGRSTAINIKRLHLNLQVLSNDLDVKGDSDEDI